MRIVRMARPAHNTTLRRKKQHVSTGSQNAEIAPRKSGVRLAFWRASFCQRIGLPPVTA